VSLVYSDVDRRYLAADNDGAIKRNENEMTDLKRSIAACEDARATVEATISNIRTEIAESKSMKVNINQNIAYRNEQKKGEKLLEDIEAIDIEKAARDRSSFESIYKKQMEKETQVHSQVGSGQCYKERRRC
jgi:septal ring factor EnvC (AmiA/AmiB activator)